MRLLLEVIAGHDPLDPGSAAAPAGHYAAALERGVRGLRIGFVRHFHETDLPADPEVAAALENVARTFQALGAEIRDVSLPTLGEFGAVNRVILQSEAWAIHGPWLRERPGDYGQPRAPPAAAGGVPQPPAITCRRQRRRLEMIAAVEDALREVDVLLCASAMDPPSRIEDAAETERTYPRQARTPFNVTGHPALAMMAGLSSRRPAAVGAVRRPLLRRGDGVSGRRAPGSGKPEPTNSIRRWLRPDGPARPIAARSWGPLMLDTALVLLVIAGLLLVVGLSQPLAVRIGLPPSVLLAAVGIGIGAFPALSVEFGLSSSIDAAAGLFAHLPVSSVTFIYVFLPLLVFEAGIVTDVRRTIEDAAAILLLAVVATIITTAGVGFALWPFAPVPIAVCLLLGAVVATTDPAAVIAIFRDVGAPARLTRLVEGEALLNDAAAIALFVVMLGMIVAGREPDAAAGLRRIYRVVRRGRHRRVRLRPHPAVDHPAAWRRAACRGDADAGLRLSRLHRGRTVVSRLRRRRRAGGRA